MTTPKLKRLIKLSSDIINIFLEKANTADCPTLTITPYYDSYEKESEVVTIYFETFCFDWKFLESVSKKLELTDISWDISREENKFALNIYY